MLNAEYSEFRIPHFADSAFGIYGTFTTVM